MTVIANFCYRQLLATRSFCVYPYQAMSDDNDNKQPDGSNPENPEKKGGDGDSYKMYPSQQIRHHQVSAIVPEHIANGVFSTGAILFTGASEFTMDFILRMQRPHQVVARVVLAHNVLPQVMRALKENVQKHEERFGKLPKPEMPKQPDGKPVPQPAIQDVYDDLKMADEVVSGTYANGIMIAHTNAEFVLDFITNFFPRSAVCKRIYMAAPQVPRLLDAMESTHKQFMDKVRQQQARQAEQQQQDSRPLDDRLPPSPPTDGTGLA